MREIRFRGISKRTGKMVYGDFLRCSFGHGEGFAIKDTVNHVNDGYIDLIPEEIIQGTESQFTGLDDCNGNQIYEGDIVKAWHHEFEEEWILPVTYSAPAFTLGNRRYWKDGIHDWYSMEQFDSFEMEVVGNIYENPDLINQTNGT